MSHFRLPRETPPSVDHKHAMRERLGISLHVCCDLPDLDMILKAAVLVRHHGDRDRHDGKRYSFNDPIIDFVEPLEAVEGEERNEECEYSANEETEDQFPGDGRVKELSQPFHGAFLISTVF